MSLLKQIAIAFAGVVGIFIVAGLLLPQQVHVERKVDIEAPVGSLFPLLDDLRAFNRWSPWAGIDPDTEYTFSDPSSGEGAWMRWESEHPNVGSGELRILEIVPNERVVMELDFGPKGIATAILDVEPTATGSRVTWSLDEDFGYNLLGRYFGLLLDGMLGPLYEKGLTNLKALAEKR